MIFVSEKIGKLLKSTVKIVSSILISCLVLSALVSCNPPDSPVTSSGRKNRVVYDYFDTVAVLYDYSDDSRETFEANFDAFCDELEICHKLFDIYNEYEGVPNVATVNKNAGGGAVKVDKRLIDLLVFAKEMYVKTDGAVNVAMGAVLEIWHDYRTEGKSVPSSEILLEAGKHCDINDVIIDEKASTVRLADSEMSLDLGAVAKGYAIDLAASVLRGRGADSYVVDVGGNLYAIGKKPDGTPFKTGVTNPHSADFAAYIQLENGAVATSGDYERFYVVGGVRYHHIINHVTLYPSDYYSALSVCTESAALSDALSTALFNLPKSRAEQLVQSFSVRHAVFIDKNGAITEIKK